MLVIQPVGNRHERFVPAVVTGLASTDQQDRHPARIEGVQDSERLAVALHDQFTHVLMFRTLNPRVMGGARLAPPPLCNKFLPILSSFSLLSRILPTPFNFIP